MASHSGKRPGIVDLTVGAEDDRMAIYQYSVRQWGYTRADRYDEFLRETMQSLADDPGQAGYVTFSRIRLRVFVARWNNARDGHRIFFREIPGGIEVMGIIHTSRRWQDHLRLD